MNPRPGSKADHSIYKRTGADRVGASISACVLSRWLNTTHGTPCAARAARIGDAAHGVARSVLVGWADHVPTPSCLRHRPAGACACRPACTWSIAWCILGLEAVHRLRSRPGEVAFRVQTEAFHAGFRSLGLGHAAALNATPGSQPISKPIGPNRGPKKHAFRALQGCF